MARYWVKHNCGHECDYQLYGPEKDRKAKIVWLEGRFCEDCWRAEELAKAKRIAGENGLPLLTGTEKQVAWAERIRAEIWGEISELAKTKTPPEEVTEWSEWLFGHKEAKWWIETRDDSSYINDAALVVRLQYFFGDGSTNWRPFMHAWLHRIEQEAKDDAKREQLRWERSVLDTLEAKESVSVWTSDRDPDDRRVYVDGRLAYDREGACEGWSEAGVACMADLCKRWRRTRIRRM